jgi:cell division protein FtsA
MARLYTGIDIGTFHVKVVIAAAPEKPHDPLRIIGTGTAASKGMRHGYIINTKDVARSIKEALDIASATAKVRVHSARVAIGGVGLDELRSSGEVTLTASAGEVTDRDVDRAIRESERRVSSQLTNRKIIHAVPLSFKVDGTPVLGRAVGMKGAKLSVETLLITALEQHYNDIIDAVEGAGVDVEDVMASPLAASLATLTKPQKMAGVVLANIGAETISLAIFENDTPISIKVLPIGGSEITSDLALAFKVPLTEAEQMKRGAVVGSTAPQKKIDDVVASRLKDMFGLIDAHLKSIGRQRLLPAGIVITGGGSGLATACDLAKATMRLPSQIGLVSPSQARTLAADATWAVAFGLCKWGHTTEQRMGSESFRDILYSIRDSVGRFLKSLMP